MICGCRHCHPESEVIAWTSCRGSIRRRASVSEIPSRLFHFTERQRGPRRLVTFGFRGDADPDYHGAAPCRAICTSCGGGHPTIFRSRSGGYAAQDRKLSILSAESPLCRARDGPILPRGASAGCRRRISRHVARRVAVRLPSAGHGNPAIAGQFNGSMCQHGFLNRSYQETISHEAK